MRYIAFFLLTFAHACAFAESQPFADWLNDVRIEARERGISEGTIAQLEGLEPDARVIGFDRRQPEFVQTFDEYLTARVTEFRIRTAREKYAEHRDIVTRIADRYQVDPEFLIAFWGLETSFGTYQGKYSILRSLVTLAHDDRRPTFFRGELFAALKVLDEGHVTPAEFVGGWAGAMGQNQFLPSSFLRYAQDYDGDGHKNIWSNQQDVWASIANYLKQNGWRKGAGWGREVSVGKLDYDNLKPASVPKGCRALRSHTRKMSLPDWQALGVTGDLAGLNEDRYALIVPESGEARTFIAGGNFRAILSYNCANKYAVSVGLLADTVRASAHR